MWLSERVSTREHKTLCVRVAHSGVNLLRDQTSAKLTYFYLRSKKS
jgi:hypothetical protein